MSGVFSNKRYQTGRVLFIYTVCSFAESASYDQCVIAVYVLQNHFVCFCDLMC